MAADDSARLTSVEQRLATVEQRMGNVDGQLSEGKSRMTELTASLANNTRMTTEMYDIFEGARNGFRFLEKIGMACFWIVDKLAKVAKPFVVLVLAGAALWAWIIHGEIKL